MSGRGFGLAGEVEGFNYSPHLSLTDKYFHRNRAAITVVEVVAAILAREAKR